MTVLIRGMEMPKNCLECFAHDGEYAFCQLYSNGIPSRYDIDLLDKPEWCELVELPTPHGKLIDADAFAQRVGGAKVLGIKAIAYCLDNAPTVIEAEE